MLEGVFPVGDIFFFIKRTKVLTIAVSNKLGGLIYWPLVPAEIIYETCSQHGILTYKADIMDHVTKQNEKNMNGKKYRQI